MTGDSTSTRYNCCYTKKRHKNLLLVTATAIAVLMGAAWLVMRATVVSPDRLDYLHAFRRSNGGIVLVGAWDAPGGHYLSPARHRREDGRVAVTLYGKPTLTMPRIFALTIPHIEGTHDAVFVEGPRGVKTQVPIAPERQGSPPRIQGLRVTSEAAN